jgi:hypothetical protein
VNDGTTGETKAGRKVNVMPYTNLFNKSLGAAVLTAALFTAPLSHAQTQGQSQPPAEPGYGAPSPDQYAAQHPEYANQNDQNNQSGAPDQYQQPQYNQQDGQYPQQQDNGQYAMQNGQQPPPGSPSGIQQAPPPIPDYAQPPAPGDGYI